MIISASRRTDIPSYHSDWFVDRLKEGYLYVRNPMNFNQISKISLKPEDVECIVFWTKNPEPMFKYLKELDDFNYYFQFSLTSYNNKIEKNLPPKKFLVPVFKRLSEIIGSESVIWRYDPILLSDDIDIEYHIHNFKFLAEKLSGYTEKCVISFLDEYPKIKKQLKDNCIRAPRDEEINEIALEFSKIALENKIILETCSEKISLENYGISHGKCIDDALIRKISGLFGEVYKDGNQREECGCVKSIDIGTYNTCLNGCIYCYANYTKNINLENHFGSPLLLGEIDGNSKITERETESVFTTQISIDNFL
ncbi:DUF1848 domain-containing protein [Fusibacter sp. 3D3]|uniref:DUF1848 domain-containing protein n=1 Tax=Fusibacter sp. 3D3 TaxID=1048380 RepID=UPI000852B12B|nr:DUF1848 domain-containing protein [Fusibacter sp. 3D3]GAU78493.1 hypothetical protein F3D3_3127 [Fusibacter sp. 3D3]